VRSDQDVVDDNIREATADRKADPAAAVVDGMAGVVPAALSTSDMPTQYVSGATVRPDLQPNLNMMDKVVITTMDGRQFMATVWQCKKRKVELRVTGQVVGVRR
jgi:hypothetical protein